MVHDLITHTVPYIGVSYWCLLGISLATAVGIGSYMHGRRVGRKIS
jgi:hypothetical protein